MKLLNCVNLQIEEFFGSSIPSEYAILSHTWEVGEVTFQDLSDIQAIEDKPGWAKIKRACQLALEQGYSHAWVDTCCIDKTNFTELTEAINSMFKWYARSTVCYAYLADVGGENTIQLQDSRWFTRGWTLQELIAPCRVEFYDKDWKFLGTRADLSDEIQQRTRIHQDFLAHSVGDIEDLLTTIPLGCRMSWAAGRVTTREEDLAYCLLGIFGVSMPLLYGEGKKAFIRLQEEIIRGTHDTSLFAWSYPRSEPAHEPRQHYFGILAESPDLFAGVTSLERVVQTEPTEYSITNKGFQIMAKTYGPLKTGDNLHMELGWRLKTVDGAGDMDLFVLLRDQGDGILVRSSPYIVHIKSSTHIDYIESLRSIAPFAREEQPLTIRKTMNAQQSLALETSHDEPLGWTGPHGCAGNYCLFANRGYAGGRGVVIISTPENVQKLKKMEEGLDMQSEKDPSSSNPPFRITEVEGKGLGMIANKSLARGDTVMLKTAVLIAHRAFIEHTPPEEQRPLLDAVAGHLPSSTRETFLGQMGHFGGHKVTDIMQTNSFQMDLGGGAQGDGHHYGNFPEVSRYNHDCRPNVAFHISDSDGRHRTTVVKPVKPGEELTISYLDQLDPRSVRQHRAKLAWGFECGCSQCGLAEKQAAASDQRLMDIQEIERALSDINARVTTALIEKFLKLYRDERLESKLAGAYTIAALNFNLLGHAKQAVKYAKLAAEAGVIENGAGAPDVEAMRTLAADPKKHFTWRGRMK
ncbi:het domain protein [Colletotrichum karsti]|uniref:Het domain protein n=1 Tax=Colletotrichum karsti TaxID=1095194 RepID=A0A9P6I7Q2_9PEZI|nr:het domain protein [Colletotrichum karsti]KAF9873550.1 het domain protein [Colletotrichum karsti]